MNVQYDTLLATNLPIICGVVVQTFGTVQYVLA